MGSTAEWRGQRKESVNLKTEQEKLLNLNNREKLDWRKKNEQSLRDMWDYNQGSNVSLESQKESRERRKRVGLKKYSKK